MSALKIYPDYRLQRPLDVVMDVFERLSPRTVPLLDSVLDVSMDYEGVRGAQAYKEALLARIAAVQGLRYIVHDFAWARTEAAAFVRVRMTYQHKGGLLRPMQDIVRDGVFVLRFTPEEKLCAQEEFWAGPAIASGK